MLITLGKSYLQEIAANWTGHQHGDDDSEKQQQTTIRTLQTKQTLQGGSIPSQAIKQAGTVHPENAPASVPAPTLHCTWSAFGRS